LERLEHFAKFEGKQLRSRGMSMSLSKEIFNLADCVSVVPALFGVLFSGGELGKLRPEAPQTHAEQGLLRSLNTRIGPCHNHEF
jgi:hypothetical protein